MTFWRAIEERYAILSDIKLLVEEEYGETIDHAE
jgi:hypothetical protein